MGQVRPLRRPVECVRTAPATPSARVAAAPPTQPVEQPHGASFVVPAAQVIIATLGMATALPAGSFPEWQDEADRPRGPAHRSGTPDDCIEENS
jgi:hypothetical protein